MAYLSYSPLKAPAAYFILTLPSIGALLLDHISERSSLSFLGPEPSWAQDVPIEGLEPKLRPLVVGVGEPVGAGLVLKGGRPLFARRLLFTSQCSLPGLPMSQTPIFRVCTTLWRKPHGASWSSTTRPSTALVAEPSGDRVLGALATVPLWAHPGQGDAGWAEGRLGAGTQRARCERRVEVHGGGCSPESGTPIPVAFIMEEH